MATNVSKPPKDKDSHRYRKWEESLARSNEDITPLTAVAFVTIGNPAVTSNERALTGSDNIEVTDNGAGSSVNLDLTDSGVTAGTYQRPQVTVDAKGRITDISVLATAHIPQYDTDPASPEYESAWVLRTAAPGTFSDGDAMGCLGGVYTASSGGPSTYELSFYTLEGTIIRVAMA